MLYSIIYILNQKDPDLPISNNDLKPNNNDSHDFNIHGDDDAHFAQNILAFGGLFLVIFGIAASSVSLLIYWRLIRQQRLNSNL